MSFTAIIAADNSAFKRAVAESEAAAKRLEQSVDSSLKGLGEKFTSAGQKMSVLSLGIVAGFGAAGKAAIDFESAFTGVEKTVDGTAEQMATLRQGIIDMSKSIPATTTAIAEVAESAGQLGIQTDNILGFTRTMIDLGEATNLSATEGATALARFANITGMAQGDFDRLGSVIVALGNNFATTEAEITEMGLRLAGAGAQVGLTQSEILSLAASLSSVGIEADAGGSAFSRLLADMQVATETGSQKLTDFASVAGMSASNFATAFKTDAVGALQSFIKGLSNTEASGQSAIGVLENMGIVDIRLRDAILRAAGASDMFAKSVKIGSEAWEENNALSNEAAKRYQTTESQIAILRNTIADVGRIIGEILLPSIRGFVDSAKSMAEGFANLSPNIQKTIVVITGVVAAIGPFLLVLGKLIAIAPLVGTAFTTMTGPIGIAIALIAGAALLIIKNWDAIKEYFSGGEGGGMFDTVKEAALSLWESIKTIFNTIKDFAIQVWAVIGDRVTALWKLAVDNLAALFRLIADNFKAVADFWAAIIDGDMQGALDALGDMFMNIFNFLGRIVTNFVSGAARAIAGFLDAIGLEKWASAVDRFADNMAAAFQPPKKEIIETKREVEESTLALKTMEAAALNTAAAVASIGTGRQDVSMISRPEGDMVQGAMIKVGFDSSQVDVGMQEMGESLQGQVLDLSDAISNTIVNFASSIGEAMGSGNFEGLGANLLKALGSLAQQMGVMLLGMGKAAVALKAMIANPIAAVAAGIALIALGAAATAAAGSMVSGATGGGGGYSGGASSSYQAATPGSSDMRGAFQDTYAEVEFKIGNDALTGALRQRDIRDQRLG